MRRCPSCAQVFNDAARVCPTDGVALIPMAVVQGGLDEFDPTARADASRAPDATRPDLPEPSWSGTENPEVTEPWAGGLTPVVDPSIPPDALPSQPPENSRPDSAITDGRSGPDVDRADLKRLGGIL